MFIIRICHIANVILQDIKSLTDKHWVLICLFVVLNVIDWVITTIGRFYAPNFQELNPLFNAVVVNPYVFSITILASKILAIGCIVGIAICLDKINFKYVRGVGALIYANLVIGGVLVLLLVYNLLPLVVPNI